MNSCSIQPTVYANQPTDVGSQLGLTITRLKHPIGRAPTFLWKCCQNANEEERRSGRETGTERDNERETSFFVSLLVDDISGCMWLSLSKSIADDRLLALWRYQNYKGKKENWKKLSMGCQEARCLLGFGDFWGDICLNVCVWIQYVHV